MTTRSLFTGSRSAWALLALVAVVIAVLLATPTLAAHAEDATPTSTQTLALNEAGTPTPGSTTGALPYCDPVGTGEPETNGTEASPSPPPPADPSAPDASGAPAPEATCIPIGVGTQGTSQPPRDVPDWPWITLLVVLVGGAAVWALTRVIRAQQRTAALRRLAERT